jgi:hypothetical protein
MQRPSRVYQILTMLIYGDYPWLSRLGDGVIEFRARPMAKLLHTRNVNIRDSLRWLKDKNFLLSTEMNHGEIRLQMAPPKKLFDDFGLSLTHKDEDEAF